MLNIPNGNVEEILKESGIIVAGFSGTSMMPMLRSGIDKIVVEPPNGKLRVNDVPLYKIKNGKLVLHRIIKIKPDGYVIRGDNVFFKEYDVKDNDIVGVLKAIYRGDKLINCSSLRYKLYVFYVRISYPVRYVLFGVIRPILGKIKRYLSKKNYSK